MPRPIVSAIVRLAASVDAELIVAGGLTDLGRVASLRDAGVHAVLLGEAIFTGQVDYVTALALAA